MCYRQKHPLYNNKTQRAGWFLFLTVITVAPVTFQRSGRYKGVFLGCVRLQSPFPPAIGFAPYRKRSQTSLLCALRVCQKCTRWRWRACSGFRRMWLDAYASTQSYSRLWFDEITAIQRSQFVTGREFVREGRGTLVCVPRSALLGGRIVAVTATLGDSRQTVKKQTTNGEWRWNVVLVLYLFVCERVLRAPSAEPSGGRREWKDGDFGWVISQHASQRRCTGVG